MKTTLDLPDDLVREMKLRAVMQHRTLRDLVTDYLRQALGMSEPKPTEPRSTGAMVRLGAGGLPVISGAPEAAARRMSPAELLALEHAAHAEEDARRASLSA